MMVVAIPTHGFWGFQMLILQLRRALFEEWVLLVLMVPLWGTSVRRLFFTPGESSTKGFSSSSRHVAQPVQSCAATQEGRVGVSKQCHPVLLRSPKGSVMDEV